MNKKLNKRELAQIEFDKIKYYFYFQNRDKGYHLLLGSFGTLSEELKDIAFEDAIRNNHGFDLIRLYFDNLTTDQKEKAFKNAIENNYGRYLFKFMFDELSKHQKLIALENIIDNYRYDITIDFFDDIKDNIKKMLQDFKREKKNNE